MNGRQNITSAKQLGLSLVELMIALALSSILTLALFEVFKVARNSFNQVIDVNETLDSAQLTFSLLQDAVNMAGFWGGLDARDLDLVSGSLAAFPGNCDGAWVLDIEQGLQGFDGREQAGDIPLLPEDCLSDDYVPYSDVLIVRRASVLDPIEDHKLDNKYYEKRYIVRGSLESGGVIFQGQNVERAIELVPESAPVVNRLLSIDMYYLEYCKDSESCEASGIGLSRYTLTGNRFVKQRLVNGVAQLQFEYGIDLNGDGRVEQYRTADKVLDWRRVRSVRTFALFKGNVDNNTYRPSENELRLGAEYEHELSESEARYKYKKFQSEFSLKNA